MSENRKAAVCETLKDRLQDAERDLQSALASSTADHPLAEPARELLGIHTEIRDMLLERFETPAPEQRTEEEPEVAMAAVQIEREAHTLKPEFMDVVKALFMWKDDPVQRARQS